MRHLNLLSLAAAVLLGGTAVAQPAGPQVVHTGKGPTGYAVTFRYANPAAKKVHIKGEWYFARPSELRPLAPTPDHPIVEGQGILPADWKPGDFPLQHPNTTGPNFPISEMTKGKDGVWQFTTPLPSGVFTYSFIVDCAEVDTNKCKRVADPGNPAWYVKQGIAPAMPANNSQVYVPSDPAFGTVDNSWQGPARIKGKLAYETYASPGHDAPRDRNALVIYTPPGYDAQRAKPYPTLYLSHGGGENELGWTTQGVAQNILDNLIGTGQIEPIVVVMPNGSGFDTANGTSNFNERYDRDLIERMIPFVESRYHVSKSADDRAFSGLSYGGMLTNSFLVKYPQTFRYYGMMSAGLPATYAKLTPAQVIALKGKSIWIGSGWQDAIHAAGFRDNHLGPAREISTLAEAGVPYTTNFVHGGHEWSVWRVLLRDFVTRTAFLPPPYATWDH